MNEILELVLCYILYLIMAFIGTWIGSLIVGVDINIFTRWEPYVVALVVTFSEYIFK